MSSRIRDGMWYTLISSNFMHASLQHLAFNMLNLFFFGRQAEMILGLRRFLTFYLSSGIVSVAAQVAEILSRTLPISFIRFVVLACFGVCVCVCPLVSRLSLLLQNPRTPEGFLKGSLKGSLKGFLKGF